MKKIISLLCVLCSLFLVSCKRDRIVEVKEETKPMQEKLSKRKNVDDIEDKEKKNILRILYSQDVKGIMWYFRFDAYPIIFPETKLEIADEYKEKISNSFFERFFVEDIEMQKKLKELPLEYRWTIYEKLKHGDNLEQTLRILSLNTKTIKHYFRFDAYPIIFPETKLEIADEYKEKISNSFFERFFVEDIEMQEKLKELPLEYRWTIYEKLK